MKDERCHWPRRRVLKALALGGAGTAVAARTLSAAEVEGREITSGMIRRAEWIPGLDLTAEHRALMVEDVNKQVAGYAKLRSVPLDNAVAPALRFEPAPGLPLTGEPPLGAAGREAPRSPAIRVRARWDEKRAEKRPASDDDVAFASIPVLARLLRSRQISSVELTRIYLGRLHSFDPILHCAITLTEDLALEQAKRADRELASGRPRGPLHGIPWGAKDLLAVPGYPTTWGTAPYKDQVRPGKATVVKKLEDAGAVLIAKLSVGELAWGDVWFGGMTRNPWQPEKGSSGSSAGSASAVAAGLVGFALGTETWGSIVSPCTVCGASGLRPTFGRVSRHGAMALAWSMDKIGPIARTVEDCALIFAAIQGADGLDPTAADASFDWPPAADPRKLRVGFVEALFAEDYTKWAEKEEEKPALREWAEIDRRALETLRSLGVELAPIGLPKSLPTAELGVILTAEAAAAFDELTRSGRDDLMARQTRDAWPNVFRQGHLIPAVEYIRANRIRTLLMAEMERVMRDVDVYVVPSYGGDNLLVTNLTGHPAVVVPDGFVTAGGTPASLTFQGRLHGEAKTLALARTFQRGTDFHLKRPPLPAPAGLAG
jgi:Asp-tRNA(Asn)/Glu-tRNA(Gln) amidotransferase A subunit family amidase